MVFHSQAVKHNCFSHSCIIPLSGFRSDASVKKVGMVVSDGSKLVLIQCTVQCIATGTFFFVGGGGLIGWA